MDDNEKDFLLAEYEASWDIIQNIDDRRDRLASHSALLGGGVTAVVVGVLTQGESITPAVRWGLVILVLIAAAVALGIGGMLLSERRANVRYRKRVNLIRDTFLSASKDKVEAYYKTENHHHIRPIGGTLPWVFWMLGLQILVGVGAAIGLVCGFQ